jgi:hypothetical protein
MAEAEVDVSETGPLKSEYLDVIISDVRTKNGFAFSVQILNTEGQHFFNSTHIVYMFHRDCLVGETNARFLHSPCFTYFCPSRLRPERR